MEISSYTINLIIPVPLSAQRLHQRGYNQATQLAQGIAAATGAALIAGIVMITSHFTRPTDTANQKMVDSLHNRLERTTKVVDNSLEVQEQMVQRLAALNDSLKTLNAANTTLRNEKEEQRQRQLLINQTIAEGIRRIDAVNAATNPKSSASIKPLPLLSIPSLHSPTPYQPT